MDLAEGEILQERVLCYDASDGDLLWEHRYPVDYAVGYPTGPRASVIIKNDRAWSMGTMGDVYCLDANSGKVLWHIAGEKEYNISFPVWGLAASPLLEGELLIVQLGGKPDACIVAFDKNSGKAH